MGWWQWSVVWWLVDWWLVLGGGELEFAVAFEAADVVDIDDVAERNGRWMSKMTGSSVRSVPSWAIWRRSLASKPRSSATSRQARSFIRHWVRPSCRAAARTMRSRSAS